MNDELTASNRRRAEMDRLKKSLAKEHVVRWILNSFGNTTTSKTEEVVKQCADVLFRFVEARTLDISGMYLIYETYRQYMSDSQYLILISRSEDVIQDLLKIEQLESKERIYKLETEYIAKQGYALNERYIITFPDNPDMPDEEWVVTEFRLYGDGKIRPIHGCKMKKDGNPYAKALYIGLNWDKEFRITRK